MLYYYTAVVHSLVVVVLGEVLVTLLYKLTVFADEGFTGDV